MVKIPKWKRKLHGPHLMQFGQWANGHRQSAQQQRKPQFTNSLNNLPQQFKTENNVIFQYFWNIQIYLICYIILYVICWPLPLWQMSSPTITHVYIIWTSNQKSKCVWSTYLTFWPLSFQLGNGQWAFSETLESWHLQSHDVARLFLIQGPILWVSCHHSE